MEEKLMTVKEVGLFLQVSQKTVLKYIHEKKIKAIKIGKDWRVPKQTLMEWIDRELNKTT